MSITLNILVNEVLEELSLGRGALAPDPTDHAIAKRATENAHAELSAREIVNWPIDATPPEAVGPFARYVACIAAPRLVSLSEEQAKKLDETKALAALVAAVGRRWSGKPTQVDRF